MATHHQARPQICTGADPNLGDGCLCSYDISEVALALFLLEVTLKLCTDMGSPLVQTGCALFFLPSVALDMRCHLSCVRLYAAACPA